MSKESDFFEKSILKINAFFRITGMVLNEDDNERNLKQRLRHHWYYTLNIIALNFQVLGEIAWFIDGINKGKSMSEITYVFPCITLSLLGDVKLFFMLKYAHHVNHILATLRALQEDDERKGKVRKEVENELKTTAMPMLTAAIYCMAAMYILVSFTFGFACIYVIVKTYLETGEIQLMYPFLILYPFDAYDKRVFPIMFMHQVWCAIYTTFSVFAPDCFFYMTSTFVHIQLRSLQYDITKIVDVRTSRTLEFQQTWKQKLVALVTRHRDLIRCIDLMEIIFSKSTLLNVVSSSFILCLAAFNILAGKDIVATMSYIVFFVVGFIQIFCLCYYGDMLTRSSVQLGDAVYNSAWYEANAAMRKDLLLILVRSQKPCVLTAWMFTEINLRAFGRILSASWSYFALLLSVYE